MFKRTSVVIFLLALTACSSAQPGAAAAKQQPKDQPSTALEALLSKHGQLVMKEFYDLGTVRDMGRVQLQALVISAPSGAQKTKGLKIQVTEAGNYERESAAFLDVDELEGLAQALVYMSDAAAKWDGQSHAPYTEIIYTSKSEVQIGFYRKGSETRAFCKTGSIGTATAYLKMEQLPTLKGFVDQAITLLKSK
ncbi:MAG TPA: hypothetical protein VGP89_06360 [Candidatus Angelobacter sp.]|jgi:hypothetical protein|nr:hypothetical protein [Candidatus Angelobacter sp.]